MSNYLDEFSDAYHEEFQFHDENALMLSWYSQRIIQLIKDNNYKSAMSFGIGHKIVCKNILKNLEHFLDTYVILEGSVKIMEEFKRETVLPKNATIIQTLFEEFLPEDQFDVIEMGFVLEHVDDPGALVRKYTQYLRPGGRMFIAVPNAKSLHRRIGYDAGLLNDMFALSESDLKFGHKRYFDKESLVDLIDASDLKIVNIEGIYLKPFSTAQLDSLKLSQAVLNALCSVGSEYPEISNALFIQATL